MTITVLLADDHEAVRAGVRALVETAEDILVVGECPDGESAVEAVARLHPDVVLMDVQMPTTDGIAATGRIVASGESQVIILTTFGFDDYVDQALRAGAAGFLLKTTTREALVSAIRRVHDGESILAPEVTRGVVERYLGSIAGGELTAQPAEPTGDSAVLQEAATRIDNLTEREIDVLGLLGEGLSNSAIADRLVISEATVKTHVSRVLGKLGLVSRLQAALVASQALLR